MQNRKKKCVIVGGGYAGINAALEIEKALGQEFEIYLLDKNSYHFRRVLLFKEAAGRQDLQVSFKAILPDSIKIIQGTFVGLNEQQQTVEYLDGSQQNQILTYDRVVLTLGSESRRVAAAAGGIVLQDAASAQAIKKTWRENFGRAQHVSDPAEKAMLLSVAVVGAGISGIETAAELSQAMGAYAKSLELPRELVKVYLINSDKELFQHGPAQVRKKLRKKLAQKGVTILDAKKGTEFVAHTLHFADGAGEIAVGAVVWTLGLAVNPLVKSLKLPLNEKNQLVVNDSYQAAPHVYSIGDCAEIIDPETGQADLMTCKEAVPQAKRLAKVMKAELFQKTLPVHKSYMTMFCIALGPSDGIFWLRLGKLDLVVANWLGWLMRVYTWNNASLLKGWTL